jgi:hypothetical protein
MHVLLSTYHSTRKERKDNNNMVLTNYLTATEILVLIKSGQVTAEQVIQDHKKRYEERNDEVRAWVHVNFDGAIAAAKSTEGLPLHGVTLAVKDIISKFPLLQASSDYIEHVTYSRYQGHANRARIKDL